MIGQSDGRGVDRMEAEAWIKNAPAMIPSLAIVPRAPAMVSLWSSRTGRLFNTARVPAAGAGLLIGYLVLVVAVWLPSRCYCKRCTGLIGWWRGLSLTGRKKNCHWPEQSRNLLTNSCGTRLGGDEREYFIRIALSSEMLPSRVRMLAFAAASVAIAWSEYYGSDDDGGDECSRCCNKPMLHRPHHDAAFHGRHQRLRQRMQSFSSDRQRHRRQLDNLLTTHSIRTRRGEGE